MKNRVRECRLAAGLTLEQLASKAHMPLSTLHRCDYNPRAKLALGNALLIARALGVDPRELVPVD